MSEEMKIDKKSPKLVERVTIIDALKQKLNDLTAQANEATQGIASITKSDVMNMILEEHAERLSQAELEKLKVDHIDQVKLALWLTNEIKGAKRSGEQVTLKQL